MIQKIILTILFLYFTYTTYAQIDSTAAKAFYKSLNEILTAQIDEEERLGTEINVAMTELNEDSSLIVKNKPLQLFLDSMVQIDVMREESIKKLQETDTIINLKEKALNFLKSQVKFDGDGLLEYRKAFLDISSPVNERVNNNQWMLESAKRAFEEVHDISQEGIQTGFNYVELSAFKYNKANIKEGEEISILSFSGDNCYNSIKYFNQYIVIIKSTGDTVRILSPCGGYNTNTDTTTAFFEPFNYELSQITPENICLIVFNKNQESLERKDFPTVIGSVFFKKD